MWLLTWSSKVAQGDLGRLDLAGDIFGHALVDALVRFPGVLDHQRAVFQQVQATVVTHVQRIAAMGGWGGGGVKCFEYTTSMGRLNTRATNWPFLLVPEPDDLRFGVALGPAGEVDGVS